MAVLLLTSFALACAYSAVIVRALLSAPNPTIRTREELLKAPLPMVVEDFFTVSKEVFGVRPLHCNAKVLFTQEYNQMRAPLLD